MNKILIATAAALLVSGCTHQAGMRAPLATTTTQLQSAKRVAIVMPAGAVKDPVEMFVDGHTFIYSNVAQSVEDALRKAIGAAEVQVFRGSEAPAEFDAYLYPELVLIMEMENLLVKRCRAQYRLTAKDATGKELAGEYKQAHFSFTLMADGEYACSQAFDKVFPHVANPVLSKL